LALSFDAVFVATAVVATAVVSVVAGLAATVPVTVAAADITAVVMFIPVGGGMANISDIRALNFWASSNLRASNSRAMHVNKARVFHCCRPLE
jgi:hypothetical protein